MRQFVDRQQIMAFANAGPLVDVALMRPIAVVFYLFRPLRHHQLQSEARQIRSLRMNIRLYA
ncbi:hypothetical protein D3C85_1943830 [compost metagenome]